MKSFTPKERDLLAECKYKIESNNESAHTSLHRICKFSDDNFTFYCWKFASNGGGSWIELGYSKKMIDFL